LNIFASISLVLLRKLSRSTGFLNRDDLRKSPSEEEGTSPFGEEGGTKEESRDGRPPSGDENGRPPSGSENGRDLPPFGDEKG
jgi:hypothetical protein